MKTLKYLVAFALGGAVGAAVTWKVADNYFNNLVEEEIRSVKERYGIVNRKKTEEDSTDDDEDMSVKKEKVSKKDIKEYAKILSEEKYTNYQKPESLEEDDDWVTLPYVISPDEFGEKDDYEMVTLTYFQDGYLCDDDGFLIEDVEGMVGKKSLETFGQYEEDSVFVRNEERKTDYEILLDYRNYTDVEEDRNV